LQSPPMFLPLPVACFHFSQQIFQVSAFHKVLTKESLASQKEIPAHGVTVSFSFLGVGWDWGHLVRQPSFGLLCQSRMIDDYECTAVGEMIIGRGNRNTWRSAPVPLCPLQITSNPGRRGGKPATILLSYGPGLWSYSQRFIVLHFLCFFPLL
jgi:hypothetical protein